MVHFLGGIWHGSELEDEDSGYISAHMFPLDMIDALLSGDLNDFIDIVQYFREVGLCV